MGKNNVETWRKRSYPPKRKKAPIKELFYQYKYVLVLFCIGLFNQDHRFFLVFPRPNN